MSGTGNAGNGNGLGSGAMAETMAKLRQTSKVIGKSLDEKRLMDALRDCSMVLSTLRNHGLSPKQYYEIYIVVYDSLNELCGYLRENHVQLPDLYELVQYSGNIVPRLYLMLTVGTIYMDVEGAPVEELLKDMIEMCRGVQNPIRGLFLRYYLSQRTKDYFSVVSSKEKNFKCEFVLTNFVEMNKLWVRLQHQGPLKERARRTIERKELQILVGSQLVRLSQVVENDIEMYKELVLPSVLEQVIQCNDVVSQEYLFDVILQVFPLEFHIATLKDWLLPSIFKLNVSISINEILSTIINKFNNAYDELPIDNDLFKIFWLFIEQLVVERPDLPLNQFITIMSNYIGLSLKWYPDNLVNLTCIFKLMVQKCKDMGSIVIEDSDYIKMQELLLFTGSQTHFIFNVITECPDYNVLLDRQKPDTRLFIVESFVDKLLVSKVNITSKQQLEMITVFCNSIVTNSSVIIQEKVAKVYNFLLNRNRISGYSTLEYILKIKNCLAEGHIQYTYPVVITHFWKLIRYINMKYKNSNARIIQQLFKYIARCVTDLYNKTDDYDLVFKLNLQCAAIADQLELSEITYDFISQSFAVYEEQLNESKTQFQALVYMAQCLQKKRSLYIEDYYNNLIVRCTLHASKLLTKQDQCRAVYLCSHLWWATEISVIGEEEGVTETFNRDGKRVLECLQRSLRVSDSIMDNTQCCELMVEILNRCLYYFIHSSEQFDANMNTKYITGLMELIKTNLTALKLEETAVATNTIGLDGASIALDSNRGSGSNSSKSMASVPLEHFNRTVEYVLQQRKMDQRFNTITV